MGSSREFDMSVRKIGCYGFAFKSLFKAFMTNLVREFSVWISHEYVSFQLS